MTDRRRTAPRQAWASYEGYHTSAADRESGIFRVFWSPARADSRGAGWYVWDQRADESDGPFISSREAYHAARSGATGRNIRPRVLDLDRLFAGG